MSVLLVEELPQSEGSVNMLHQLALKRVWRVTCSSTLDGPITAMTAGGIPSIGDTYFVTASEKSDSSFCQNLNATLESASSNPSHAAWIVTADYGSYKPFPKDPLEWALRVEWGQSSEKKICTKDAVTGKPICNSAGDSFKAAPEIDDSRTSFTVKRNELFFDPDVADDFRDTLNEAVFCGFADKTVKCKSITASLRFDNNVDDGDGTGFYYEVTYEFEVNNEGWQRSIQDRGFNKLVGGKLVPITNNGQPPSEAEFLDGSGGVVAPGGTVHYLNFDVYPTADWSAFGFDFTNAPGLASDAWSGDDGDGEGGGGGDT